MRIRWKLLILLLAMAMIPLGVVALVNYRTTTVLGKRIAGTFKSKLIDSARDQLGRLVNSYAAVLHRDGKVIELIVRRQAREASLAFSQPAPPIKPIYFNEDFEEESRQPDDILIAADEYFRVEPGGEEVSPVPISFGHQVFKIAPDVAADAVIDDIARLQSLSPVYQELSQANSDVVIWQYTSTESGVHGCYPGHGGYPPTYDHRQRSWYIQTKQKKRFVWTPPYVDVTTGRLIMTASAPVRTQAGEFVGVTAIDFFLTDMLEEVDSPTQWQEDIQVMLVVMGPETPLSAPDPAWGDMPPDTPLIVAKQDYHEETQTWEDAVQLEPLSSPDRDELAKLIDDLKGKRSGVRELPICNRQGECVDALWAYGPLNAEEDFPPYLVLVVPQDRIIATASEAESYVLGATREMVWLTGGILLLVLAAVGLAAWRGSHTVTRPVEELVAATGRLALGDFETTVRLNTCDEFQKLGETFNDMVPKLRDQIRVRESLSVAMEVQQALLPDEPPCVDGLDIAGVSVYCDETGGDYFDYLHLSSMDQRKLAVVIGDVTGHGIGAALLMATGRALWRSRIDQPGSLADVVTEMNRHLVTDRLEGRFMTMMCMVVDAEHHRVHWVGAGHDPILIYDPQKDSFEELVGVDVPLGVVNDWRFQEFTHEGLKPGQVLMVGTDGIWEARNNKRELFGKDNLREVISQHAGESAQAISAAITDAIGRFRAGHDQEDDVTMVIVKVVK